MPGPMKLDTRKMLSYAGAVGLLAMEAGASFGLGQSVARPVERSVERPVYELVEREVKGPVPVNYKVTSKDSRYGLSGIAREHGATSETEIRNFVNSTVEKNKAKYPKIAEDGVTRGYWIRYARIEYLPNGEKKIVPEALLPLKVEDGLKGDHIEIGWTLEMPVTEEKVVGTRTEKVQTMKKYALYASPDVADLLKGMGIGAAAGLGTGLGILGLAAGYAIVDPKRRILTYFEKPGSSAAGKGPEPYIKPDLVRWTEIHNAQKSTENQIDLMIFETRRQALTDEINTYLNRFVAEVAGKFSSDPAYMQKILETYRQQTGKPGKGKKPAPGSPSGFTGKSPEKTGSSSAVPSKKTVAKAIGATPLIYNPEASPLDVLGFDIDLKDISKNFWNYVSSIVTGLKVTPESSPVYRAWMSYREQSSQRAEDRKKKESEKEFNYLLKKSAKFKKGEARKQAKEARRSARDPMTAWGKEVTQNAEIAAQNDPPWTEKERQALYSLLPENMRKRGFANLHLEDYALGIVRKGVKEGVVDSNAVRACIEMDVAVCALEASNAGQHLERVLAAYESAGKQAVYKRASDELKELKNMLALSLPEAEVENARSRLRSKLMPEKDRIEAEIGSQIARVYENAIAGWPEARRVRALGNTYPFLTAAARLAMDKVVELYEHRRMKSAEHGSVEVAAVSEMHSAREKVAEMPAFEDEKHGEAAVHPGILRKLGRKAAGVLGRPNAILLPVLTTSMSLYPATAGAQNYLAERKPQEPRVYVANIQRRTLAEDMAAAGVRFASPAENAKIYAEKVRTTENTKQVTPAIDKPVADIASAPIFQPVAAPPRDPYQLAYGFSQSSVMERFNESRALSAEDAAREAMGISLEDWNRVGGKKS